VNLAQLWADYEAANRAANDAHRSRGCPDCGDIAVDKWGIRGGDGERCQLCKALRAKETA
jgi:hypothetical protein